MPDPCFTNPLSTCITIKTQGNQTPMDPVASPEFLSFRLSLKEAEQQSSQTNVAHMSTLALPRESQPGA